MTAAGRETFTRQLGQQLDLLLAHHERIETWILEWAGIQFDAMQAAGRCAQ
jgi:hypothetical protein